MFFFVLVGILFFYVISVTNIIFWWSVFVFMDLIFIFLCKNCSSGGVMLNYFIIQESLALIFLFVNGLFVQFIIVMTKMGLTPFHFWIFSIIFGIDGWLLMWFLTFQKLPFFGVLLTIFFSEVLWILLLGFFVCYYQLLLMKDYKFMLSISSTESFNWILMSYMFSLSNVLVLFFYYFFLSLFMIPFFVDTSLSEMDWLMMLIYMNLPLGVSFFVKIFSLGYIMTLSSLWMLLLFFFMFISFLCFSVWMIGKSMKGLKKFDGGSTFYFSLLVCMTMILI